MTEPTNPAGQGPVNGWSRPGHAPPVSTAPAAIPEQRLEPDPESVTPLPAWIAPAPAAIPTARGRAIRQRTVAVWVLVLVVLLCGGVATTGWFITNRPSGPGEPTPQAAVTGFLDAVYVHEDSAEATNYLCVQADPDDTTSRVDDARKITEKYNNAIFSWGAYTVTGLTTDKATVRTVLTLSARDHGTSTQTLTISTINDHGWWVCGVRDSGR